MNIKGHLKSAAWVLSAAAVGSSIGLGVATMTWWWLRLPPTPEPVVVRVDEGSSLVAIAQELEDKGLLKQPELWRLIARLRGLDGKIQQGEYELSGLSPAEVLSALVEGRVQRYSVTFPEGVTLAAALDILWQRPALERVLESRRAPELRALAGPGGELEGLFFPDTYVYARGDTDLSVLTRARQRMERVLFGVWYCREPGLPYASPLEALTMASIVEKETGQAAEREQIAGVFVRRLRRGMRLETDPTVIYGLGADYRGDLLRVHLQDESNPYNTYRRRGLPPGPIALPGEAAIRAALHPADGKALFFVAKGDGSHEFSENLEQHQAAVRRYQLRRRPDYRSSPAPVEESGSDKNTGDEP